MVDINVMADMKLKELIEHPKRMDRDTLYELRELLALYPYFQTARLLLLQNLYLLHDPTFDEELRRAAIYITDRKVIFQMVESAHYELGTRREKSERQTTTGNKDNRTMTLIDDFLDTIPKDGEETSSRGRRPTPADAAVDYVAYLLETEGDKAAEEESIPEMPGQDLIDSFIKSDKRKFVLNEEPLLSPPVESVAENESEEPEEEYFTETLARIYIKQGRYSKALEIIQRLSLQVPKKNAYFADQIRFLEKLILNNNKKK